MAPKRAAPRTESVNRLTKEASNRQQRSSGQGGPANRLTQESDQSIRRRSSLPAQIIDLTSSDISSEISQIDTPLSIDRISYTASLVENSPPSKRRRLDTAVDYSHIQYQNPEARGGRIVSIISSDHPPSIVEAGSCSFNRRKTGSCNSKRQRGKGHVGGSSSDQMFLTDSIQPTTTTDDSHYLPPTAHSSIISMPANIEDHPSTSKVSSRGGVSTKSHEPSGGSSTTSGHWFRSFTCFTNSADSEQAALDLSVESDRRGSVQPGAGSKQSTANAAVFSNPTQTELAGEGSSFNENITRLVSSLPYSAVAASPAQNPSSSSSRNLRHQRSGGGTSSSTRQEPSGTRRSNQGGSRQSSSRNAPTPSTSNSPGVHIHGASSSSQSQSHHHSIQGSGVNYRIMQLKTVRGDVQAQMILLQEINQSLLMGSDDSLAGLAVQELVSGVIGFLSADDVLSCLPEEEMIEIKNLCCNILAHLMDVIPKAADTVVMAVPLLINIMSCSFVGDILERIINVLEQVSRRNGRDVLHYGAVPSVMGIYDFVTVAQHRTILSMVANCFANVRKEDFDSHVAGCLPILCERLSPMASTEPRCLERVCLCFARIVHAFKSEPEKLRHIASFGLCEHLRHLLAASPPIVSNMKDVANMLATLCTHCPDLAVDILKMGYAETVYNLLTDQKPPELSLQSPTAKNCNVVKGPRCTSLRNSIARTLESRGAENVSAIINLIRAMIPPVQESGFLLPLPTNPASKRGSHWCSPTSKSNVQITLFEEQCAKFENLVANCKPKSDEEKSEEEVLADLVVVKAVNLLLPMLLDLYTELNGTSSRLKCIEAIQGIACNVSPCVLSWVVSPRAVSSMVADMLGNPEFSLIAAGIQLVNIFVTRVPNVFAVYFRKEGVFFHLKRLSTLAEDVEVENPAVATSARTAVQQQLDSATTRPSTSGDAHEAIPYHLRSLDNVEPTVTEPVTSRITSRRRRRATRSPHFIESIIHDSPEPSPSTSYESSEASSGNSTLDMDLSVVISPALACQSPGPIAGEDTGYHDNSLRAWIKTQCQEMYNRIQTLVASTPKPESLASKAAASGKKSARRHHSTPLECVSTPPRDLVPELEALSLQLKIVDDPAAWIEGLVHLASLIIQQIRNVSDDEAPSPFEIQHSGLLNALQDFLIDPSERRLRLFLFLRIFLGPRYSENFDLSRIAESPRMLSLAKSALLSLKQKPDVHELAFPMLVNCLLDCLHQQEHFQVLMNPASQASTEVYAEEMIMAMRPTAPSLTSTPQRRSSGRRTLTHSEEDPNPTPRPVIPRRLAAMAPGYVKLELIRQVDEPSAASTSRKSPSDSTSPIWERAAPVTSLQVSSLLTAHRLRNQFIQRIMIDSVMQSPEGGFSRDLLLDYEEGLLNSFSIPPSVHRRRGGTGGGGRRTAQERSEVPPIRSGVRPEFLSMERQLLSARSGENLRSRSMSLLAAFGMLQFPGSTAGAGNSPATTPTQTPPPPPPPQLPAVQQPGVYLVPPTHSSNSHGSSVAGMSGSASGHVSTTFSQRGASSSNTTSLSSSTHHSTRQQQQTQSSSRSSHHHHPSMMPSGSSSTTAELLESVTSSGASVPVFYIDGFRIPDRMPLYQALRTYSPEVKERARQLLAEHRFSMTDQNREDRINAFIWRTVHTLHYRLEKSSATSNAVDPSMEFDFPSLSTSPNINTSSGAVVKHSPSSLSAAISCLKRSRRSEEPSRASPSPTVLKPAVERLFTFLEPLTECRALNEGYLAANLGLLRVLYGLSEFGNTLDDLVQPYPIVPADHFQSPKLSAKASRQLQDVFYVLAGNLPGWLVETISTCPFLFPFSVRQNFFYVHNFDRERTILHLQDTVSNVSTEGEAAGSTSSSRGGSSRRDRDGRSSFVQRISSHFGRHALTTVRHGGFNGGATILENLLAESSNQLNKHKIVVNRDPKRLLRAAETAMNDLRNSRSGLEIAFEGEVGFGLGPTLEFYTLVSHQLMTASLNLWHGENYTTDGYIIAPPPGLYPRPLPKNLRSAQSREIRSKFYFLGQLMARALLDWRQLDLSLSPVLFKWFLYVQNPEEDLVLSGPRVGVTPADLALVDPSFAKHFHSLLKLSRRRKELVDESLLNKAAASAIEEEIQAIDSEVDDLCVTFVLPGYQIDLCRNGSQMSVTGNLLGKYLDLVANWYLVDGVRRQVTALIAGFDSVLPGVRTGKLASLFRPDECEGLFCGSGSLGGLYRDQFSLLRTGSGSQIVSGVQTFVPSKNSGAFTSAAAVGWDVDTLMKSCLCDHGYTHQSTAIQYLFEIMSEFDETQRRLFIQFATGSPRLPIGGFRALKPPLKIVMKREAEEHADQHLPSVMTCQNYLKLPNYSSKKIMLEKLLYAIHEGQHAFHLS